ncbi:MAG: hypothetical protein ACI9N9_002411 [Enterobacterales bacterium]
MNLPSLKISTRLRLDMKIWISVPVTLSRSFLVAVKLPKAAPRNWVSLIKDKLFVSP